MRAKQLAEIYEELKEFRRRPQSGNEVRAIEKELEPGLPIDTLKVLELLGEAPFYTDKSKIPASVVRMLDIKTLADRVFGDENQADAWLQRPNRALSSQRPVDLVQDELGAAVVREILEQIDHGIFA